MSTYKPVSAGNTNVLRAKHIYGIWYGASLGFLFAVFAWGIDAYNLSQVNNLDPWTKFAAAALLCTGVGCLAGWLAARQDKPLIAFLIWLVPGLFFSWLVVSLPLVLFPRIITLLESGVGQYLHYIFYPEFLTRSSVAFGWIVIFVGIAGLLQLPLSEGAVFSTSIGAKLMPILVGMVLMGIAGTLVDGITNEPLRTPVEELNDTIQYAIDHQGQKVELAESRRVHLGSLRVVRDLVTPQRKLLISGYTPDLGQVDVLVKFDKAWVECQVFYGQPINCKQVGTIP